ncbi:MAG: cobalamin biosynthesis protein [Bacillota bacterium]
MNPPDLAALVVALALDLLLGEPPLRVHPVVWMGKLVSLGERVAPRCARGQLLAGFLIVAVTVVLFAGLAAVVLAWAGAVNPWVNLLVAALFLKPTFAVRELFRAAGCVKDDLTSGRLEAARANLRALVSRETNLLDGAGVSAATIESVAENLNDSFVAPTLYYLVAGVPGAVFYRAVNTCDAMIGYRGRYECLGKFAARLDDALNFVPARLTALLVVLAAMRGGNARAAWRVMRRDHRLTLSPNAGWPMSAMAGALGVELAKPGCYLLGSGGRLPDTGDITAALQVAAAAAGWWILVLLAAGALRCVLNF